MATTTNLSIDLLNSSDYVSVDPINNAIEKLDVLGVDYIKEQGKSGDWNYRIWNSGTMECFISSKSFGDVAHTNAWGVLYNSAALSFGNFPSTLTFAAAPACFISFSSSSDGGHRSFLTTTGNATTTKPPSFALVDPNSGTATGAKFSIYCIGRSK